MLLNSVLRADGMLKVLRWRQMTFSIKLRELRELVPAWGYASGCDSGTRRHPVHVGGCGWTRIIRGWCITLICRILTSVGN